MYTMNRFFMAYANVSVLYDVFQCDSSYVINIKDVRQIRLNSVSEVA